MSNSYTLYNSVAEADRLHVRSAGEADIDLVHDGLFSHQLRGQLVDIPRPFRRAAAPSLVTVGLSWGLPVVAAGSQEMEVTPQTLLM